jgi:hypothetical protein
VGGAEVAGAGSTTGGATTVEGVTADAALVGILSFWPTVIRSVFRLFAVRMALAVVPVFRAIRISVSPDFTT